MSLVKFRGCLVGALIGDCLGSPFEGAFNLSTTKVIDYFKKIGEKDTNEVEHYTDDTAMTWALGRSLVRFPQFNPVDAAESFKEAYFKEPLRGYGGNVIDVFDKWKTGVGNDIDVFQPAKEQFKGSGSYGNGGAMRISPVALLYQNSYSTMLEVAKESTRLTHSNQQGYNGAVLQCIAIWLALNEASNQTLDVTQFINTLSEKWDEVVSAHHCPYVKMLSLVKKLALEENVENKEVVSHLGNSVSAQYSVTTAIYCFLKASHPIATIPIDNAFERTIAYAVSMGGDTDTIASMAGAIAGAYYGIAEIPQRLQNHCEDYSKALELADDLHQVYKSKL